ncbi:MAG: chemotaxis response regulator protein-glutamate methylesterase [Gracilibacteraceae bacterium]|jgi:two-component system chemotaxis response regulator CheB|nr:chemotaxis response regulator protein-glutamate methylesterase [Gracilibacteraceae bacterium]
MATNKKIRVLIVDDSHFFRGVLSNGLRQDARIEVVGTAADAAEAKNKIRELSPDVLTLDVEMPGMNGIDFLKQLMSTRPLPVVMVSSLDARVFDILAAGAVDFVQKPKGGSEALQQFFTDLAAKILIASIARLRLDRPTATATATAPAPAPAPAPVPPGRREAEPGRRRPPPGGKGRNRIVLAFGASTGGTDALAEVLQRFPADTPGIIVTQHMPAGFTRMFAERLNRICPMEVKEAENHDPIVPGRVLIAPGGMQMGLETGAAGYAVKVISGEKVSGHCPSVDYLFTSVARTAKKDAVGVIMTGMGGDGADGLLLMRQAGAYTLGQDKDSCVVYGMPMVAMRKGAVCKEIALDTIAAEVLQHLRHRSGAR